MEGCYLSRKLEKAGEAGVIIVSRTFSPVIDMDKCRRCGSCEQWCPDSTCMLSEEGVIFDYRYCKGCGICAEECSFRAIEMIREE